MKRQGEGQAAEPTAQPKRERLAEAGGTHDGGCLPELHARVADAVLAAFAALPKTGKPQPNEHTVLAGFVVQQGAELKVVSLGTGTKCLAGEARSPSGDLLNDSHAEVIARRALLCWLQCELQATLDASRVAAPGQAEQQQQQQERGRLFNFCAESGIFERLPRWGLHFFCSQLPCGDACIYPSNAAATESSAARTGAKALALNGGLPQAADVEQQQQAGLPRRKPGRGAATLSMSCSDKLARWLLLGLQGALLSAWLPQPLPLASLTTALPPTAWQHDSQAASEALRRALVVRTAGLAAQLPDAPPQPSMAVIQLPATADAAGLPPSEQRRVPSGVSINWNAGPSSGWMAPKPRRQAVAGTGAVHEVTLAASGRKAGTSKKGPGWDSPKTRSRLCKAALWEAHKRLRAAVASATAASHSLAATDGTAPSSGYAAAAAAEAEACPAEYGAAKRGTAYGRRWAEARQGDTLFARWIQKDPALEAFA